MANRPDLSSAEITFHAHATEDQESILRVLESTLRVPAARFTRSQLEGHHGNPILLFRARLSADAADQLVEQVFSRLSLVDRQILISELEKHVDSRGALYLRIGKQFLYSNEIALSDVDPIRIKLGPRLRRSRSEMLEAYGRMLT